MRREGGPRESGEVGRREGKWGGTEVGGKVGREGSGEGREPEGKWGGRRAGGGGRRAGG